MKTTGPNSWKSWGIAVLCSFINFLCLTPIRIAGLLFIALMESYNINRKMASQPIAVATIARCLIGPLTGYLCGLFGCRSVIVCGAVLSSIGLGACFFAQDMTFVIISLGLFYGSGLAFGNTLIPMVIKQHFDKHASKANGIALTGCCVNAIIIPPIFQYLLAKYGSAGAFLITSGIMLNALPAAILLKNPNYAKRLQVKSKTEDEQQPLNESPKQNDDVPSTSNHKKKTNCQMDPDIFYPTIEDQMSSRELPFLINKNDGRDRVPDNLDLNMESPKLRNKVSDSVSKGYETLRYEIENNNRQQEYQIDFSQSKSSSNAVEKPKSLCQTMRVYTDPSYLIILISQGSQPFILTVIWTIIIDLSRDKDISGNLEIYFIMFLPVSELIGYVALTWITDNGYLSTSKFCTVCYLSIALSTVALAWSYDFLTMMIAVLVFSFFGAAITTISPVVIYEFIDEKRQSMAMASRFVLFVPVGLATPSLIGYFRENLGSYDGLLYLLAVTALFCGLLFFLMPYTMVYKRRRMITTQS